MKRIVFLFSLFFFLLPLRASAQIEFPIIVLPAGDSLFVTCGQNLSAQIVDAKTYRLNCGVAPLPTVTPTPTSTPVPSPSPTPGAGMADMHWHPPGAHGDRPYHEHGSSPPAWVSGSGYKAEFTHVAGTPNENMAYFKHTAFKGWVGRFSDVDWFGIFHLDFNPGGEQSRFHSYQLWLRDSTGAVSHMHGWLDFGEGNNTLPNLRVVCGVADNTRPLIMANKVGCSPVLFNTWYANAANPGLDIGFSIAANYYAGGDPVDPSTWIPVTMNVMNTNRRVEFAYYGQWDGARRTGTFWTTQLGNVVSGPTDPMCNTISPIGDRNYTIVCIQQTIQPTLPEIKFPNNVDQRVFPGGSSLKLPN